MQTWLRRSVRRQNGAGQWIKASRIVVRITLLLSFTCHKLQFRFNELAKRGRRNLRFCHSSPPRRLSRRSRKQSLQQTRDNTGLFVFSDLWFDPPSLARNQISSMRAVTSFKVNSVTRIRVSSQLNECIGNWWSFPRCI